MVVAPGVLLGASKADSEEGDATKTLLRTIAGALATIIVPRVLGRIKLNDEMDKNVIKPFLVWIKAQKLDPNEVFDHIQNELETNLDEFYITFEGKIETQGQKVYYSKEEFVIMMKEIIKAYWGSVIDIKGAAPNELISNKTNN